MVELVSKLEDFAMLEHRAFVGTFPPSLSHLRNALIDVATKIQDEIEKAPLQYFGPLNL